MTRCPSEDWDDYCHEQDKVEAERRTFVRNHYKEVVAITAAILANPYVSPFRRNMAEVVDKAIEYVALIVSDH